MAYSEKVIDHYSNPKNVGTSAIASSSLATEWLKGKTVDQAVAIDNMDLVEELNLPPVKIHCSVLAEDAIKAAINDYRTKNGLEALQFEEKGVH